MPKEKQAGQGAELAPIPTGLKDLIAMCEAEVPEFKYNFHKKPAMVELIQAARGMKSGEQVEPVIETKKAATKKAPKKEAISEPATDTDGETEITAEVDAEAGKSKSKGKGGKKSDDTKDSGKKDALKEEKADEKKGKKKAGLSVDEVEALRKTAPVKEILDNKDYSKSGKIRKLYHKLSMPIGNVAKVVDVHYSFAYCVIDAYRKGLLNEKGGKSKGKDAK